MKSMGVTMRNSISRICKKWSYVFLKTYRTASERTRGAISDLSRELRLALQCPWGRVSIIHKFCTFAKYRGACSYPRPNIAKTLNNQRAQIGFELPLKESLDHTQILLSSTLAFVQALLSDAFILLVNQWCRR